MTTTAVYDADAPSVDRVRTSVLEYPVYWGLGVILGILFIKSEVLSWYRIQEMFRFQSFHMYGVIISAIVVARLVLWALARAGVPTVAGSPVTIARKEWTPGLKRYWMGGTVFGLGWALLGACPGPIMTFIGAGYTVFVVPLVAALAGTMCYALVRDRLPH